MHKSVTDFKFVKYFKVCCYFKKNGECICFFVDHFEGSTLLGQTYNIGSVHAIRFDGIDDYVDLANLAIEMGKTAYVPNLAGKWVHVAAPLDYLL